MTVTPLKFHKNDGLWVLGDKLYVVPKVQSQAAAKLPMHLQNKDEVVVFEGSIIAKFVVTSEADNDADKDKDKNADKDADIVPFVRQCFPDSIRHYCIQVPPYNDSLPQVPVFPIAITMAALRNDFNGLVKATTVLEERTAAAAYEAARTSKPNPNQGFWLVEATSIAGRPGHATFLTIAVFGDPPPESKGSPTK